MLFYSLAWLWLWILQICLNYCGVLYFSWVILLAISIWSFTHVWQPAWRRISATWLCLDGQFWLFWAYTLPAQLTLRTLRSLRIILTALGSYLKLDLIISFIKIDFGRQALWICCFLWVQVIRLILLHYILLQVGKFYQLNAFLIRSKLVTSELTHDLRSVVRSVGAGSTPNLDFLHLFWWNIGHSQFFAEENSFWLSWILTSCCRAPDFLGVLWLSLTWLVFQFLKVY